MADNSVAGSDSRSVRAYDDDERVRRYDRDMDLLHPNRHRMTEVTLEVLSELEGLTLKALELGTGTGFFASRFLQRHSASTLVGVDGAASMITLATSRLQDAGVYQRARLLTSSFEEFDPVPEDLGSVDIVFSSYALHHLRPAVKAACLKRILAALKPGGWFLNADLVTHADPGIEAVIQRIQVDGILARNAVRADPDPRFVDSGQVRDFLDDLEESEGDCPLSIDEDLALLRRAGIPKPVVFWHEYREVVLGGRKTS